MYLVFLLFDRFFQEKEKTLAGDVASVSLLGKLFMMNLMGRVIASFVPCYTVSILYSYDRRRAK